jgi:hypothetical protein
MTDTELEALAYVLGDSAAADLLARKVDMQLENDALTDKVNDLESDIEQNDKNHSIQVEQLETENDALTCEVEDLTCEVEDLRIRVAQLERDALCR